MSNLIVYAMLLVAFVMVIKLMKSNYQSGYRKHLVKCYKLNIKPFYIWQYYYYRSKEK